MLFVLGHHADAIALPQATYEILFEPGKFEAAIFDFQDFWHVSPNHPTNVNA
jgi:hypothetical protein